MLLVITLQPDGQINLNSAEADATGKAFEIMRTKLHELAAIIRDAMGADCALVELAAMAERQVDHAKLREIGFTKIAVVAELRQQ